MTTNQIQDAKNGWACMDGHGCFPAFFGRTEDECVAEALRRGHRVTHFGRLVVGLRDAMVVFADGTIDVLMGNVGIEVTAG